MRVPRPGVSGGLWLGGARRRTIAGGLGVHRRDNDIPQVLGSKSTNCGSGAWPEHLPVPLQQL